MLKKTILALALASAVTATALPASANDLTWSYSADVTTLDPHALDQTFNLGFLGNIYEGLVERGPDMKLKPALATSWELVEPTRWRFHLRQDVYFQEGQHFTADDVVFSLERSLAEGSRIKSSKMAVVSGAEKVDDYTVDILMSSPDPILINNWSNWLIISHEWAEEHGIKADATAEEMANAYSNTHANGTGPFQIAERRPDDSTIAVPFEGWWGKPEHNLTQVIYRPIQSDATRTAALLSGELDLAIPVPVQDQQRVEQAPGVELLSGPELRVVFIGMDVDPAPLPGSELDKNPLSNRDVREAVYSAINEDAIARVIMRGQATPTASMIPREFHGFMDDLERYPYDPEAAKALLDKAGYADGFSTTMECPNNRYVKDEAICTAIVGMLDKIGIEVDLDAMPIGPLLTELSDTSARRGMWFLGLSPGNIDANGLMQELVHTRTDAWGTWNAGNLSDPELDRMIEAAIVETDTDARDQLLHDAQRRLNEEVYFVPLHQQNLSWGVSDKVDLIQRPDDVFVWKWAHVE